MKRDRAQTKQLSIKIIFTLLIALFLFPGSAWAVRIKDMAHIKGVRNNQLIGYGLVVGLNGTGDGNNSLFTNQSVAGMLERLGITVDSTKIKVENVAAVILTAHLPPFAKAGSRLDVIVSSLGDAESLQGGTLLMTPLKGPDGKVYAVAQGPVSIGGFGASGGGGGGGKTSVFKNHPTVGQITGGAIIEREVPNGIFEKRSLQIVMDQSDFTTAVRLASKINRTFSFIEASPIDSGTININLSANYSGNMVELIASIEGMEVTPDQVARVILNERTGTVVMGENVRISTVAISHGNLSIQIKTDVGVSQPLPFSEGTTTTVSNAEVEIQEQEARLTLVPRGVSIGEVITALNAIGVTPRDLIAILQAMKSAGALQADLEII